MFSVENKTTEANYFEEWLESVGQSLSEKLQDQDSSLNKETQPSFKALNNLACQWYIQEDGALVATWLEF